ncbi:hypothetical protein WMY93_019339 [Mugilogobius chulae]|uniref:SRCR domain-containing protein n=1 Tax=Mugilogobius chulae TaxID=88201 RepID=A0AAW0NE21_9GOBI
MNTFAPQMIDSCARIQRKAPAVTKREWMKSPIRREKRTEITQTVITRDDMELIKGFLLLQICFSCQALLNSTTQTPATNSSVTPEGNFTQLEETVEEIPYVKSLSGKCRWTLKLPNDSSLEVHVDAELADKLALQICWELGCGGVYDVKKKTNPSNHSCFSECHYETGNLQNCSHRVAQDCVVISEAVCGAHMVRLSGGVDRCAGRVELWRDGQWGSVCDDNFDLAEADVVCRQAGCGYALNVSGQDGLFPPGRGQVLLDDLNCNGTELNLWDCPATEETDCGHKEDAGVVCSEMRAVRLSGGLDRCSGKVEIHRNGTWGTVCENCWNKDLASTVCSMLQCDSFPRNYSGFDPPFSHNNGPQYYYHGCPTSSTMWECREFVNIKHLCAQSYAAAVVCNNSLGLPVATTASPSVTTEMVPEVTTHSADSVMSLSSLPLLSLASVSLLLLVFLIVNTVLCCHYKSRHAFLVQQSHVNLSSKSKQRGNSYEDSVNLTKVSSNPAAQAEVSARPLWMQLSNVDSTSAQTDSFQPSFSTFRMFCKLLLLSWFCCLHCASDSSLIASTADSQRFRADGNPLMKPLDRLHEEASEPFHGDLGAFSNSNGADFRPLSIIKSDSFDTSSTSSEETYKNTDFHSDRPLCPGSQDKEDDEGPIYSPVSPETDTSSGEDYDDVDTV